MRHLITTLSLLLCAALLQAPLAHAGQSVPHETWHPVRLDMSGYYWNQKTRLQFAPASGGPFGIDHRVHYDNHGLWNRNVQLGVEYGTLATVLGGSLLLGDHSRLGDTFWRSLDAVTVSAVAAQVLKRTFQRERPSQTGDPDKFFKGFQYQSFPSGEVTAISAAVTPFIVRYGHDHPAVYALAALPLYDAFARVKVHGHWQSDVIAGALLGTAIGIWTARRQHSLLVGWLPGGFSIGYVHRF